MHNRLYIFKYIIEEIEHSSDCSTVGVDEDVVTAALNTACIPSREKKRYPFCPDQIETSKQTGYNVALIFGNTAN